MAGKKSFWEKLKNIVPPEPEALPKARDLMKEVSSNQPAQFMGQVDQLRGAREGSPDLRMQALQSPAQRAVADRYAWGADIAGQNPIAGPLALIPPIGYEAVKGAAQAAGPLGQAAMSGMGRVMGGLSRGPQGQENLMSMGPSTSPASVQNLRALLAGYSDQRARDLVGRNPKLLEFLNRR